MNNIQLSTDLNHTHCVVVDQNGNGLSTFDAGHQHVVRGYAVQPAQNHVHHAEVVSGQIVACGAGGKKPCNCGRK